MFESINTEWEHAWQPGGLCLFESLRSASASVKKASAFEASALGGMQGWTSSTTPSMAAATRCLGTWSLALNPGSCWA